MAGKTDTFIKEVKDVLENNILNFWAGMEDPKGGIYGKFTEDGTPVKDAPRSVITNARLLWALSAAYKHLRKKEYMVQAANVKDYFFTRFVDHKYGGVYSSVNADGERLDTYVDLLGQGSAIFGLSRYYSATKDEDALKIALNIYEIVEKEFRKSDDSYSFVLTRDFKPAPDKPLNEEEKSTALLYLLEGYIELYKVHEDETLRQNIKSLLKTVPTLMLNKKASEASWIILDGAFAIKDMETVNEVRPVAEKLYKFGIEKGQVFCDTTGFCKCKMHSETLNSHLWAWKYLNIPASAEEAFKEWEQLKQNKCICCSPLHYSRACINALSLFE